MSFGKFNNSKTKKLTRILTKTPISRKKWRPNLLMKWSEPVEMYVKSFILTDANVRLGLGF